MTPIYVYTLILTLWVPHGVGITSIQVLGYDECRSAGKAWVAQIEEIKAIGRRAMYLCVKSDHT